jgi:hypothetical protein
VRGVVPSLSPYLISLPLLPKSVHRFLETLSQSRQLSLVSLVSLVTQLLPTYPATHPGVVTPLPSHLLAPHFRFSIYYYTFIYSYALHCFSFAPITATATLPYSRQHGG